MGGEEEDADRREESRLMYQDGNRPGRSELVVLLFAKGLLRGLFKESGLRRIVVLSSIDYGALCVSELLVLHPNERIMKARVRSLIEISLSHCRDFHN
jgi:hypothetical protein